MKEITHAYIGRRPCCGNVVALVCDDPESKRQTATAMGGMIRDGLEVERVTIEQARETPMHRCTCGGKDDERAVQAALL